MRQAWVPRVVNVSLAVFLLLFLVPLVRHLGGKSLALQAFLIAVALLLLPFVVLCLCSAARPGSLGRFARKVRARRAPP